MILHPALPIEYWSIIIWIFFLHLLKKNNVVLALPNLMNQRKGDGDIFVRFPDLFGISFFNSVGCLAFLLVRNLKGILSKVEKFNPQESLRIRLIYYANQYEIWTSDKLGQIYSTHVFIKIESLNSTGLLYIFSVTGTLLRKL